MSSVACFWCGATAASPWAAGVERWTQPWTPPRLAAGGDTREIAIRFGGQMLFVHQALAINGSIRMTSATLQMSGHEVVRA